MNAVASGFRSTWSFTVSPLESVTVALNVVDASGVDDPSRIVVEASNRIWYRFESVCVEEGEVAVPFNVK